MCPFACKDRQLFPIMQQKACFFDDKTDDKTTGQTSYIYNNV